MTDNIISRLYKSTVHIALPSIQYAQHLKDVISVDEEVSNKVVKSFSIVTSQEVANGGDVDRDIDAIVQGGDDDEQRVLRM
jgi:predicted dinucleotide-binding enzyme